MESGAVLAIRGDPETPAVGLDDRPAYGEAHAKTVGLGCKERIEQLVQALSRYAMSLIADRDLNSTVSMRVGPDAQATCIRFAVFHSLYSVVREIENNLLKLNWVSAHR